MCKTGKVHHKSREGAMIWLRKTKNKGLSAYRCRMCGDWHLGNSRRPDKIQARIDQLLGLRK